MQAKLILISLIMLPTFIAEAARFNSSYPCTSELKTCVVGGERIIDGFKVHRDCWEWSYDKICNYPSKNDCGHYSYCYEVGNINCLLQDSLGNCVNQRKEFSCKRWLPEEIESQKTRVGLLEKDGEESLVCEGIPCLDGNCIDKSYLTNGEMMDAIAKLSAVKVMKPDKNGNFKLFGGVANHCSKKATSYSNCCHNSLKGWGSNIGANCSKGERELLEARRNNLCIYVGKENKGSFKTVVKHHYCCFDNMLDKVIQVEGRKQLGINFGSSGRPNCQPFDLEQIKRLDFSKMDLSEFIEDFKNKFAGKYQKPSASDLSHRVKSTLPSIHKYDNNPDNLGNNKSGWSRNYEVTE